MILAAISVRAVETIPCPGRRGLHYLVIVTRRDGAGLPISGFDAHIASICRTHNAALAARNLKDFQDTGIDVIDPWQAA